MIEELKRQPEGMGEISRMPNGQEIQDKINELIEASNRQESVVLDLIHQAGRILTEGQQGHLRDKLEGTGVFGHG